MHLEAHHFVYLSTIVFLVAIFFLAKNSIADLLNNKREEIKNLISETRKKHQDTQALYAQLDSQMKSIAQEREVILKEAQAKADIMLQDAEQEISKMKKQHEQDLARRIAEYESQIQNKIIADYSDKIVALLQEKVQHSSASLDMNALKKVLA